LKKHYSQLGIGKNITEKKIINQYADTTICQLENLILIEYL